MKETSTDLKESTDPFLNVFQGSFSGILRWPQLDELWLTIQQSNNQWYVYQIGENVPQQVLSTEKFKTFIKHLDGLIRKDHGETYCGIVYVDNIVEPSLIKVYDPNNLGSSCGSSGGPPPLPGWTISLLPPSDLPVAFAPPANRRRWWKSFFLTKA